MHIRVEFTQFIYNQAYNEENPVYLDEDAPIESRVKDLLSRMTPEEKIDLLHTVATAISDEARACWNELDQGHKQTAKFSEALLCQQR